MGFYKNPIIEEGPKCILCFVPVMNGDLLCSSTCNDLWIQQSRQMPAMDWENDCE